MPVFIAEFSSSKGYCNTLQQFDIFHKSKAHYFQRAALENISVILLLGITHVSKVIFYFTCTMA